MDKCDDELEELIEKLAEKDIHHLSLSHHGRNVQPKIGGFLHFKGLKLKIEKDLMRKRSNRV